jgi:hypothetical protein
VFPVATVCGAAKHAGETALFAGVITADAGEHTGWNHGMSSRATFFAILFRRVRPDNVANLHCKLSLLCPRRERPRRRRTTEHRDEIAAFHLLLQAQEKLS